VNLEFVLTAFAAIFAIVNPIGNIPVFQAVTDGYSYELKQRVIVKICVVTVGILFVFAIFGQFIFAIYGITIPAFKIAGGILLFSIAFSMLQGERSKTRITDVEKEEALQKEAVGIVPLGIPMFAGPGAITTVMILVSGAGGPLELIFVFSSIILTTIISYLLLKYSDRVFRLMGRSGAMAFTRIMGLLLSAVAVTFVLSGVEGALPQILSGIG
jgi:multiple antibiotic resistance protein